MTEQEKKAIKWIQNVRDDAVVTLGHIKKNEPNVSPLLYNGRKEKAETIIKGFEELEQYRDIGTVEELKDCKEIADNVDAIKLLDIYGAVEKLKKYMAIGAVEECQVAVEKKREKKPTKTETEGYRYTDTYRCPTCGGNFSGTGMADYCYHCGQKLNWEGSGMNE